MKIITPTKMKDPLLQSLKGPMIPSLDLHKSKKSEVSWNTGEQDINNNGAQSAPGNNHFLEKTTKTGGNSSEKVSDTNLRSFKSKYSDGKVSGEHTRQQKNEKLQ